MLIFKTWRSLYRTFDLSKKKVLKFIVKLTYCHFIWAYLCRQHFKATRCNNIPILVERRRIGATHVFYNVSDLYSFPLRERQS